MPTVGLARRRRNCQLLFGCTQVMASAATSVYLFARARARTRNDPIGLQFPANRLDQRSASSQFEQPSSTSTVSLSTASLSTSTTKSEARHELDAYRRTCPTKA
jgi:hypothetical protein